jgi:tRNA nucleotidyltransferase (CCA-adding enzyme)
MKRMIQIARRLKTMGITSYFVGGYVRDGIMGITSDDIDICLIGVKDKEALTQILSHLCDKLTIEVGEKFPVWIATIDDKKIDFALGRAELKSGQSRKDFDIIVDDVSIEQDLLRRDFTINAIAKDILSGEYIDPYGGISDITKMRLTHVSDAFAEDSLRVLRAARFASRFDLLPSDELKQLCKSIKPTDISNERVGMELYKMLHQATKPSIFFRFLKDVDWLDYYFKELSDLIGIQQDPIWHPEGDAFEHTMHTLDQASDYLIRLAMICHDLGKASTTVFRKGRWTAYGHDVAGLEPTQKMLENLKYFDGKTIKQILVLVEFHMVHTQQKISDKYLKKILRRLLEVGLTYEHLVEVCRCDVSGRPPIEGCTPDIRQKDIDAILLSDELRPIVTGQVLIDEFELTPSPSFKTILKQCLDLQDAKKLNKLNYVCFVKQFIKQVA